jgi:hypothetical protein
MEVKVNAEATAYKPDTSNAMNLMIRKNKDDLVRIIERVEVQAGSLDYANWRTHHYLNKARSAAAVFILNGDMIVAFVVYDYIIEALVWQLRLEEKWVG